MQTDVAVVGGGLAGALAAAMLGRAGHDVVIIDPHEVYPPDFRCEKLEQGHMEVLGRCGLAEAVLRTATHTGQLWIARFGRIVDKVPFDQYGLAYDRLVNAIRAEIPPSVRVCRAFVDAVTPHADGSRVRLSGDREIRARLVVLASGPNWTLRQALGMSRELVSPCHSITIGFDLEPMDGGDFAFPGLQYNPERGAEGMAYLSLFRIGRSMRANLFLYQALKSPWLKSFREDPDAALRTLMPRLARVIGSYRVVGPIKVRPTDLYHLRDIERPGLVLVGDAFATPCPATGTGSLKVFTDIERLCRVHIPRWLETPGMGEEKMRAFYADPVKTACDAMSVARAFELRALSINQGLSWEARRWLRFGMRLVRWASRSALQIPVRMLERSRRSAPSSADSVG
ncbi:FAD-dependent oxidoreductase [Methylobacterium nodulans]|uniref:Monooxygenase FAD-binding n=1 Tax=Methylobacterium nodulans (strain LMG 21967 / CNCM I-2342 / ORS 2060) TaxID=460265 RepID=B8IPB1_METNO|nr:FAD-dependent monooxygenase [Methylobacterium nodulans]ACL60429.1 monooxygenase FAD-binding [Methylobacterium nodulans ORS 2060]